MFHFDTICLMWFGIGALSATIPLFIFFQRKINRRWKKTEILIKEFSSLVVKYGLMLNINVKLFRIVGDLLNRR